MGSGGGSPRAVGAGVKPFSVWNYYVLSPNPLVVRPATPVSDHATAGAARRAAKEGLDGGLFNGPRNLTEVRGSGILERWIKQDTASRRGREITLRMKSVKFEDSLRISLQPRHSIRWKAGDTTRSHGPYTHQQVQQNIDHYSDVNPEEFVTPGAPGVPTWEFSVVYDLTAAAQERVILGWAWVEDYEIKWEAGNPLTGKWADSLFLMEMATTLPEILKLQFVENPEGWESGYINRNAWASSIQARRLGDPP